MSGVKTDLTGLLTQCNCIYVHFIKERYGGSQRIKFAVTPNN
jgi:hypothetical protein